MRTRIIEVTQKSAFNYGKFLVGQFDAEEWARRMELPVTPDLQSDMPLLRQRGWSDDHVFVLDLETGEGAVFLWTPRMRHALDDKHRIWVCPMFGPFVDWLGGHREADVKDLPGFVELDTDEGDLYGYRRGANALD